MVLEKEENISKKWNVKLNDLNESSRKLTEELPADKVVEIKTQMKAIYRKKWIKLADLIIFGLLGGISLLSSIIIMV